MRVRIKSVFKLFRSRTHNMVLTIGPKGDDGQKGVKGDKVCLFV